MRFFNYILSIILLLVVIGCDLPHEPGPMPEHIIDTEYVESMNIMGVLRLDDEIGSSFIHVQRTMTTEEIYTFEADPSVQNAAVTIVDRDSYAQWIFQHSADSLYSGYYYDSTFTPINGHTYKITITADSLPALTASTTVPRKPRLDNYTIEYQSRNVRIDMILSSDTYQYKIYLLFQNDALETTLESARDAVETIEFNWSAEMGNPLTIMVTGLDENLTRYGNSSISFIPNTYHEDGSTVNNGYGCFGAVAVTTVRLN